MSKCISVLCKKWIFTKNIYVWIYIYINFDDIILNIILKTNAINFISNVKLNRVCDICRSYN